MILWLSSWKPYIMIPSSESASLHLTKSDSNPISTTTTTPTTSILGCKGARLGESASSQQWREMTPCMIDREESLMGIFALHISKSGGTSLCNAFKNEQCFIPPFPEKESNCWDSSMKTPTVDFKS